MITENIGKEDRLDGALDMLMSMAPMFDRESSGELFARIQDSFQLSSFEFLAVIFKAKCIMHKAEAEVTV